MRPNTFATTAFAVLLLAATTALAAPGDDPADDHQSVTGHADIASTLGTVLIVDTYSFAAIGHKDGRVSGQFELRAKYLNVTVRAHGVVECLFVTGNRARLGGRVTQSTFESGLPVGTQLTWSVMDNGEGGKDAPDTASMLLGNDAAAYCALGLPYPEYPIRRGNVQVRP
jgi:hypothetical protein